MVAGLKVVDVPMVTDDVCSGRNYWSISCLHSEDGLLIWQAVVSLITSV